MAIVAIHEPTVLKLCCETAMKKTKSNLIAKSRQNKDTDNPGTQGPRGNQASCNRHQEMAIVQFMSQLLSSEKGSEKKVSAVSSGTTKQKRTRRNPREPSTKL